MELNKKELKKLMTNGDTVLKARKKVQQLVKYWGYDNTKIYVNCYSCISWGTVYSTDLYVELYNGDESEKIVLGSIEVEDTEDLNYSKFEEITWDIFKTIKNNMIKELNKYNYNIEGTKDYSC